MIFPGSALLVPEEVLRGPGQVLITLIVSLELMPNKGQIYGYSNYSPGSKFFRAAAKEGMCFIRYQRLHRCCQRRFTNFRRQDWSE